MIIDFHIHPFYSEAENTCFYKEGIDDWTRIREDLERAGISKACGSVIRKCTGESFEDIKELNDRAIWLAEKMEGVYIPGVHIHPSFPDESCEELKRMSEKGVKLIGELVPYYMGWESYYDKSLHQIYEYANELKMTISIHTQCEESIDKMLECFPDMLVVGAHPGDKQSFFRHLDRMKKFENYYLDLSGTGIFRYGLIKNAVNAVGSERLLFGTDYPICNAGMYVEAVKYERLSTKDEENIFAKNAERLLSLEDNKASKGCR